MLRPDTVVEYAKDRAKLRLSDFNQLMNGVAVGGRIVVGGDERVAAPLRSIMTANRSLGMVLGLAGIMDRKLDPHTTFTFDTMAVAQLIMCAKNESFHSTIDTMLGLLQKVCVEDGKSIEMGLQILRERADEIGHL